LYLPIRYRRIATRTRRRVDLRRQRSLSKFSPDRQERSAPIVCLKNKQRQHPTSRTRESERDSNRLSLCVAGTIDPLDIEVVYLSSTFHFPSNQLVGRNWRGRSFQTLTASWRKPQASKQQQQLHRHSSYYHLSVGLPVRLPSIDPSFLPSIHISNMSNIFDDNSSSSESILEPPISPRNHPPRHPLMIAPYSPGQSSVQSRHSIHSQHRSGVTVGGSGSVVGSGMKLFTSNTTQVSPLVASCRHLLQRNGSISGNAVAKAVLPCFPSLDSAIPSDNFAQCQGLLSVDHRTPLTHARIREFIMGHVGPTLHELGYGRGHRIALVLPNGPELALAILSITNWASCVPLNANGATVELQKDLQACKAAMIIGMAYDTAPIQDMARALKIPFCGLQPSDKEAGIFQLVPSPASAAWAFRTKDGGGRRPFRSIPMRMSAALTNHQCYSEQDVASGQCMVGGMSPGACDDGLFASKSMADDSSDNESKGYFLSNEHEDECLVLFTSGTTGTKKLVPHNLGDIMIAAAVIAVSWNLSPDDVNCNLMPLFHVGGIVRQIFAPILSAGSVICCPAFDATVFWTLLLDAKFTWYYAAPTMHQIILANQPPGSQHRCTLRMIANAAGGLLPSLAQELRHVFGANVLPSYGMTECMPISSPPATYELEKPGTSGVAVGPEIAIFSNNYNVLPPGREGSICVRGRPCFQGYGGVPKESCFLDGGWFNTGDLGYLDEDGYLYITGRSKEVINRGGEIISPMEVEEAIMQHPSVQSCLAFSANHDILQEVVGIVIVPDQDLPKIDLPTLHAFLPEKLTTQKWPQCLVYMDALPKSHTNKLLRVNLGQRLNLPMLTDSLHPVEKTFVANCPPQGTDVGLSIARQNVVIDPDAVQRALGEALGLWSNTASNDDDGPAHSRSTDLMNDGGLGGGYTSVLGGGGGIHDESTQLIVRSHPHKAGALVAHVWSLDRAQVIQCAQDCLDAYLVPSHVILYEQPVQIQSLVAPTHDDAIAYILQDSAAVVDPLVQHLQELVRDLLDLDCLPAPDTNFFHIGGSSLMASQLASRIRKIHNCAFSGADVFRHNTCFDMAKRITGQNGSLFKDTSPYSSICTGHVRGTPPASLSPSARLGGVPLDSRRLPPETSWLRSLFQLLPLFVVFPVWQFTRFFFFFTTLLSVLNRLPGKPKLWMFVLTLVVYHALWVTFTPLIFVAIKWSVIGRYRPGRHAVWSNYYLRWWFVDVCRKLIGRGVWGSHDGMLNVYYRLLGASIGQNVRISLKAEVAEFDLVTIGSNSKVEYATVRGFAVDNGAILFGPVSVGQNSSVGARSVVAPYTSVPSNTHLGAATSSYEVTPGGTNAGGPNDVTNRQNRSDPAQQHVEYNRQALPEPGLFMQTLVGHPIMFLVDTLSHIPAMLVLFWLLAEYKVRDNRDFRTLHDMMGWLCNPKRLPFYLGIRVARSIFAPFFYMAAAIVVKKCVIGKFEEGPRNTDSQWQLTRHWLAARLFSRENMQEVTDLLGRHYEATSILYRILGAKVGKRVFWPGHQPVFNGEFDLLEIGDDVVFGSRTSIFVTTIHSLERVVFCAGANVSDNTVVLPGGIVGKNAVLGSNTVCPRGWYLPEGSIWLGADGGKPMLLERGVEKFDTHMLVSDIKRHKLQMQGDDSTLRPFGKASERLGETPYFVLPCSVMILFTMTANVTFSILHACPLIGCVHIGACILYGWPISSRNYAEASHTVFHIYVVLLGVFFFTHFIRIFLTLFIEISAKWLVVGRRQEGRYNWYVCIIINGGDILRKFVPVELCCALLLRHTNTSLCILALFWTKNMILSLELLFLF
jgi:acyl-CoA synthetase (AMP-forming)/AMP-acid ligase II/acetyltransferase-like isoleucine patch superfamily enzyme